MRLTQVAQHFVQRARLRLGERKRQGSHEPAQQRAVYLQHRRFARAATAVGEAHRELLGEELIEFHPAPRSREIASRQRLMQEPHACPEVGERVAPAQLLG